MSVRNPLETHLSALKKLQKEKRQILKEFDASPPILTALYLVRVARVELTAS